MLVKATTHQLFLRLAIQSPVFLEVLAHEQNIWLVTGMDWVRALGKYADCLCERQTTILAMIFLLPFYLRPKSSDLFFLSVIS